MPKPPLIQSPGKREAVIAAAMALLLLACLLLTFVLTGAALM